MDVGEIVPYGCVFLDATMRDILHAIQETATCNSEKKRQTIIDNLKQLWTTEANPNYVMPCLSVRSGLDLYLNEMHFPPGSEIIMSALNIPDMVKVVKYHKLKIVPLDISIDNLAPKSDILEELITNNTVAILIAHVYGTWVDMEPFFEIASRYNLPVIEDCAESFCGFEKIGDHRSDLALFSFGTIKYCTAFGGAIMKIKDKNLFERMDAVYQHYPYQLCSEYLSKLLKVIFLFFFVNTPTVIKPFVFFTRFTNVDYQKKIVEMLRGFPKDLINRLRHQPCTPLLCTMWNRFSSFNSVDFRLVKVKGDYVSERLPDSVASVGSQVKSRNYWLFPVVVECPDEFVQMLFALGVYAYRGATQLNVIEPESLDKNPDQFDARYPHETKYLIDHVVYLPVNHLVPFYYLDKICNAVILTLYQIQTKKLPKVKIQAKL